MAYKTFAELIVEVEKELALVAGTAVQTYAEDHIAHHLQQEFNDIFEKRWWEEYSSWQTYTLDGTTGKPSSDISSTLNRITDISVMYRGGTNVRILLAPQSINPTIITGSTALFYAPVLETTPNRIFKVYPVTAVGTVDCYVRTYPGEFDDDSPVKFDADYLVLSAAKNMCATDGGGSLQLQDLEQRRQRAEERVLRRAQSMGPVPINPVQYPNGLTEWA